MVLSTYPFQKLIERWQEQHKRPEHVDEPAVTFYSWRVFSFISTTSTYLIFQLGCPLLVILADRTWPNLSGLTLGSIMLSLVAFGFFLGFYSAKSIDAVLLKIELRNPFTPPTI